jgi:hypothetical protein
MVESQDFGVEEAGSARKRLYVAFGGGRIDGRDALNH